MAINSQPVRKSYWVIAKRFRAGEYPGAVQEEEARRKIRWLLDQDLDFFMDLTEDGEYNIKPYARLLHDEATKAHRSVLHKRLSIPDFSTTSQEGMVEILDIIDTALSAGRNVYLHCLGGQGRTGTVVGCYLVRHGISSDQVLGKVQELRQGIPNEDRPSPENEDQRRMVKQWTKGK
jgi:protein tyrosine/serine phosphatase